MSFKLTILGAGSSAGTPVVGCNGKTCLSNNPKNKRTRCSSIIQLSNGNNILIDTSPDLRIQSLRENIDAVDVIKELIEISDPVADDKTIFDGLGNTLDEFRLSGSFTTSEFFQIENGTAQTGNKLHSRSGTLYWGNTNLQTGGSGLYNMVEDNTP